MQRDRRKGTNKCKATRFTKEKLDKLWPYLSSKSISTGVTSEFNSEKQDDVLPRYMKKAKVMKTKDSVTKSIPSDMNDDTNNTCENCGKRFLRKRCLVKHFDLCISELNKPAKLNISRTASELRNSFQVKESSVFKLQSNWNCLLVLYYHRETLEWS